MLVLKHLHDWSFDECEREVRGSLVYRAFCRIDGERVPDAKTLIRLARLLDEPVLKDVLARLVALGRERRVVRGRRLRVDTTVVETNIHYPTDATLLADGVRVLTRTLRRIGGRVRERTRSVARRVFEIAQRSRTAGRRMRPRVRAQSKAKMKVLYQGLMRITRAVVRQAEAAVTRARNRHHAAPLRPTVELIRQVLAQTRARVLRGDQLTSPWTRSPATPARRQTYDARITSRPRTKLRVPPPAARSAPGRRSPRYSRLATTFRSPRSPGQTESCRQQDGGVSGSSRRAVALAHGGEHTTVRRRATL